MENGTGEPGKTLPGEITSILGGRSSLLLLKGLSGSGKTSLSLEIAVYQEGTLYISTRKPAKSILSDHPWLVDTPGNIQLIDAWIEGKTPEDMMNLITSELKSLPKDAIAPVIVIDTWEGLISLAPGERDWNAFLNTLRNRCSDAGAHLVLVSEWDEPSYLDSIADHVITLRDTTYKDAPMRLLSIQKLSGRERAHKAHVFTLKDAKFKCFDGPGEIKINQIEKLEVVPDVESFYSSGIRDFDKLLGGGFKMGTFNLIEIGNDLLRPIDVLMLYHLNNFLNQHRGAILSPIGQHNACKMKIVQLVGPLVLNEYMRVMEERILVTPENRQYVISLNDKESDFFDVFQETYDYLEEKTNYIPMFSFIEYSPVYFTKEKYLKGLLKHLHFVNNANVIELAVLHATPDVETCHEEMMVREMMRQMAESHFSLSRVGNAIIMTDMKHGRKNFAIETGGTPSELVIRFKEIV